MTEENFNNKANLFRVANNRIRATSKGKNKMIKDFLSNFWRIFLAITAAFLFLFGLPVLVLYFFGEMAALITFFVAIIILMSVLIAGVVTYS